MDFNKVEFGADRYYKKLKDKKIICVDFDNTVCLDEWPYVGPIIPGAIEVLKVLESTGHKLILYTQRSYSYPICCQALCDYTHYPFSVDILSPAIKVFTDNDIKLFDVNENSLWEKETKDHSRKIYMDYLIDDHVMGTKRYSCENSNKEICKIVDWWEIDKFCVEEGLYETLVLNMTHDKFYIDYIKNFNNKH